jgi:signal transduction histidine kinase
LDDPDLLFQIVVPEDREMFKNHQLDELLTNETFAIDFQIISKTGEKHWIGHICQQVHAKNGRIMGRRVSNRDITERKSAEQNLIRSERLAAIGRLAASLSHEINNPLQAIYSSIELLQGFSLEEKERKQYLHNIHFEIERLMKINSEILDFSRESNLSFQEISILPVIEHSLFLANTQLKHANITVKTDLPEDLPQITASSDQLTHVFLNLIINAAENMPEGGDLQISVIVNQNELEISFTDTGNGIPTDDLELIFEPFFTTKNRGTGLGLSISQKIIKRHQGTITAQSTPGYGSTFTVMLPILSESAQ